MAEALGLELSLLSGASVKRTCLAVAAYLGDEALLGRPSLSAHQAGWLAEWLSLFLASDVWSGGAEVNARTILAHLRRLELGGPRLVHPEELLQLLRRMAAPPKERG